MNSITNEHLSNLILSNDVILPICDTYASLNEDKEQSKALSCAIALGIALAKQNFEHFKGAFFKFQSLSLLKSWGKGNLCQQCSLQDIYSSLLNEAIYYNVAPEQLPKKLLLISNAPIHDSWFKDSNCEEMQRDYDEYGYVLPDYVVWHVNKDNVRIALEAYNNKFQSV